MATLCGRARNDEGGSGRFAMGLLTGTVLGAGVAMLFAPKSGAELRDDLSARADTLASRTRDGFRTAAEHVEQWVEKGKEAAATVAGVAGGRPS